MGLARLVNLLAVRDLDFTVQRQCYAYIQLFIDQAHEPFADAAVTLQTPALSVIQPSTLFFIIQF